METKDIAQTGSATYCPEDNKLRLYVGRVPRPEYEALRAEGWTATPKQDCNFVAHWTPERRDTALAYGDGFIGDEDQSPTERAADRAERFGDYRDKRTDEATGHADRYDAGPSAHGFQSQVRAERSAARHDRIADRAGDAWSKAEYWTRRTSGVISHALHVSAPDVRMGRIKILETEIRKAEKYRAEYVESRARWIDCAAIADAAEQTKQATLLASSESGCYNYKHPRPDQVKNSHIRASGSSLWTLLEMHGGEYGEPITGAEACGIYLATHAEIKGEGDWLTHYRLRLAYETQMMEAQGGRAGIVEMIPGGWITGGRRLSDEERQIVKVNKSPITGRVVSVLVRDNHASTHNHYGNPYPDGVAKVLSHTVEIERASADCYRAPTPEELIAFEAANKARKAAAPKVETIPLVNPTDADAERIQAIWNAASNGNRFTSSDDKGPPKVARLTQAQYSAASKGSYGRCETVEITGGGFQFDNGGCMRCPDCPVVAKVRTWGYRLVVLTDKPQKAFAGNVWHDPRPAILKELADNFPSLEAAVCAGYHDRTKEQNAIFDKAWIVGIVYCISTSQNGWSQTGHKWAQQQRERVPAFTLESA